jgi:O-6-methylguanine DNA methyltransferase
VTFTERVYEVARQIPAGKVLTYADVAAMAGNPRAVRAVGTAMSHNLDPSDVPCHRVVGSDGRMRGYAFGGVDSKVERLREEGVVIAGDRVDLSKSRWTP